MKLKLNRGKHILLVSLTMIFILVLTFLATEKTFADDFAREGEEIAVSDNVTAYFSYVEFSINNNLIDSFYEVLLTNEEEIYIPLMDILYELELHTKEYNQAEELLELTIHTEEKEYYFDLAERILIADGEEISISDDGFVVEGDEIYLSYEEFEKWLPVSISWDPLFYEFTITTEFKTLTQLFSAREQAREALQKETEFESEEVIMPEGDYFAPGIINYNLNVDSDFKDLGYRLDLNYLGHLLYGDFRSEITIRDTGIYRDNLRLFYPDVRDVGEVTIGDHSLEFADLIDRNRSVFGVRLDKSADDYRYGVSNLSGEVPEGSDVELHYKGDLIDYQRAEDGTYNFENFPLDSRYNEFEILIYTPQGEIKREKEVIASQPNHLAPEEFEYKASLGVDRSNDLLASGSFNYGFNPDLSFKSNIASLDDGQRKNYFGLGTVWNPDKEYSVYSDLYLGSEGGIIYSAGVGSMLDDWQLEGDFSTYHGLNPPDREQKFIKGEEEYLDNKLSFVAQNNQYNVRLGYDILNYSGDLEQELSANYRFSPYDSSIIRVRNNHNRDVDSWSNELRLTGLYFGFDDIRLSSIANLEVGSNQLLNSSFSLGFRHDLDDFDYSIALSYGSYGFAPEIRTNYEFSDRLNFSGSIRKNSVNVMFDFKGARRVDEPTESIDYASRNRSWLSGRVFLDETGEGVWEEGMENLSNVGVMVDDSTLAYTDEEGKFFISGVAEYDELEVSIAPYSLDALFVPAKEYKLKLRPGLGLEVDFPVVAVSGISGQIEGFRSLSSQERNQVEIKLYDEDGNKVDSTTPEVDGFYMLEEIKPGGYELELLLPEGIENSTGNKEFEIPFTDLPVWLQGKDFKIERR